MFVRIQSIVRGINVDYRLANKCEINADCKNGLTNVVRSDRIDLSNFVLWIAIMYASEMLTVGYNVNAVMVTLVHV